MWRGADNSWTVNLSVLVPLGPTATIPGCGNPIWQTLGPHTLQDEVGFLPAGGRVDAIAISSDFDGKGHPAMFIGNPGGGIMRWGGDFPSSSNPAWQPLTDHIPNVTPNTARIGINSIASIAIHPSNPRIIYATTNGSPLGLLSSNNGGDSWSVIGQGQFTASHTLHAVTVDSTGKIYVAADTGFYVSENGGSTFQNIASGSVANASFEDALFFADGQTTFQIFAAVIDSNTTNNVSGVWQVTHSTSGYQWTQIPFTLKTMTNTTFASSSVAHIKLAATPGVGAVASYTTSDNNPGLLNIFQLTKGRAGYSGVPKWSTTEQFFTQGGYDMGVGIGEDGRTYGGGIGLAQADAQGNVLNLQSQFGNIHVDEHVVAAYGGKIYAGTDGGLYRFTPQTGKLGGATSSSWEYLNSSTLENFLTESVGYSPLDPFDILAGHQDNGADHLSGGQWKWLSGSNESDYVFFDPNVANKGKIAYVYDASNKDFLKSYDGGVTLSKHLTYSTLGVPTFLITFHPTDKDRSLANFPLAGNQFTVRETTDGWETTTNMKDLAPPINNLGCPRALAYAGKYIYVAASNKIFQYDGTTWTQVFQNSTSAQIVSIQSNPASPNAIYFASAAGNIFLKPDQTNSLPWSTNNGGDLQDLTGAGITSSLAKLALIPNPGKGPNLYAATSLGIFKTAYSNGSNPIWTRMDAGFPDSPIWDLQVNPENRMIYAATYGRGVWYTIDLQ